jgi:hypothetical protein
MGGGRSGNKPAIDLRCVASEQRDQVVVSLVYVKSTPPILIIGKFAVFSAVLLAD